MNRIKELREEKSITQQELAQRINTTPKNIYRWENGLNDISGSALIDLANVFGCSIDYLVGREGEDGLIRTQNEIEKRKELRPSTLKLVDACAALNDMGIAVVIGYVARLIEENPEFLLPSARRV